MDDVLSGNLEDLELTEVVRVIALSERSGVLRVESAEGRSEIIFSAGRIRSVRSSTGTDTLADVLLRARVFVPTDLSHAQSFSLDDIFRAKPDSDAVIRADAAIAERMELAVLAVLAFATGQFEFQIADPGPFPQRFPRDTTYCIADGIDAEALCAEADRRITRRFRHVFAPIEAASDDNAPEVFVVDDDPRFLDRISKALAAAQVPHQTLLESRQADKALAALRKNPRAILLLDLVMPRPSGRGILGGLHVLRLAQQAGISGRVFMLFDVDNADARSICTELGARVLRKPSSPGQLASLLNPVLEQLGRPMLVDEPIDFLDELRSELGMPALEGDEHHDPEIDLSDHKKALGVLKSLLAQVTNPTYEDEIPLLVLRFCSAFFSRGALFVYNEELGALMGLGAYGIGGADPGRTIHQVHIPFEVDTVFTRALREQRGVRQPFYESEYNRRLEIALAGPRPTETYTAPLLSPRGIEAVLYADNALDKRAFPDITLLEIFLQQAGVALERSDLVRQVSAANKPLTAVPAS